MARPKAKSKLSNATAEKPVSTTGPSAGLRRGPRSRKETGRTAGDDDDDDEVLPEGKVRVGWAGKLGDKRTDRLVEWLEDNPVERQKLFSDSSQDAKEENRARHVAKGPKLEIHKKMALYIFPADDDEQVKQEINDAISKSDSATIGKYAKAVENRIASLKRKYREFNDKLSETGAGLTEPVDQIREDTDISNLLDSLLPRFPFWERLHGLWRTLPNFNPQTTSSEPGQPLERNAKGILFPKKSVEDDDGSGAEDSSGEAGDADVLPPASSHTPINESIEPEQPHTHTFTSFKPTFQTHSRSSSASAPVTNSNQRTASKGSAVGSGSNKRTRIDSALSSAINDHNVLHDIAKSSIELKTANLQAKRQKMELQSEERSLIIRERMQKQEFEHKEQILKLQIELARINAPTHHTQNGFQPPNNYQPIPPFENYSFLTGPSGSMGG